MTHMDLRYALVETPAENVPRKGRTPVSEVTSLALLQQGFLQRDIDYVIYWTLALRELERSQYQKALDHFIHVKATFADKFTDEAHLSLDQDGLQAFIRSPSLHLNYNLAYCYSVNDEYQKAIEHWNAFLIVGFTTPGGSRLVSYTPNRALISKNQDAIKLCAGALFNRAFAYEQSGQNILARNDYEAFIEYCGQSEVLAPLLDSVRDSVIQNIRELGEKN